MGMAASQVRFMQLTARKNEIGRNLQSLSLQKMSLTRDMTRISREYQNALNTKTLKWSNNAGVSYSDLSYGTLMRPGAANKNKPYLITNNNEQVVLDSKYAKYASMISPNGAPGGDWESNRAKILSELTGISQDKINAASEAGEAVTAAANKVNALKDEEATDRSLQEPVSSDTASQFFKLAGHVIANGVSYDIGKLYNSANSWQELGSAAAAKSALTALLNGISNNMKNYLTDSDYENFKKACDNYLDTNGHYFGGASEADKQGLNTGIAGIKQNGDNYSVNMKTVLDAVLGSYKNSAGSSAYGQNSMGTEVFYTRDKNTTAWQNWKIAHDDWQKRYDEAVAEHKAAVNADNQALNSEEESNIKFYEQLFSAIAEKGWVENSQIEDNSYLNNMLQNNQYFITTMEEQADDGKRYFEYSTDIASNMNNVYQVNDSDILNEALVKYEHEKSIINEKESRIDTRMTNLETEQSAINNMMKGVETVRNDNVERTFSIFS